MRDSEFHVLRRLIAGEKLRSQEVPSALTDFGQLCDDDKIQLRRGDEIDLAIEAYAELTDLTILRALSLRPPWSWMLVRGHRLIDNRWWKPRDGVSSWIAIHAGMHTDEAAMRQEPPHGIVQDPCFEPTIVRGAIVGIARLTDVVPEGSRAAQLEPSRRQWFIGPYGWHFEHPIELSTPIPCNGHSTLWALGDKLRNQVFAALRGQA